jgi:hypothetical protein
MMRHLIHRLGLLALTVVVSLYGCGGSSPERSGRATSPEKKTSESRRAPENTSTDAWRSLLSNSERPSMEEPAGLTTARDDTDLSVQLQALETWGRDPEKMLDSLTHALVNPDEKVRARAQELLEIEDQAVLDSG